MIMHSILLVPMLTDESAKQMATLSAEIWREYWTPILGADLVEHAIKTRQSLQAIRRQAFFERTPHWFVLDEKGRTIGYTASRAETSRNTLYIAKVYLAKPYRGMRYASEILDFHERTCALNGLSKMELHVNRKNEMGIRAYLARGFEIEKAVVTDLGSGHSTEDYVMAKKTGSALESL